MTFRCYEITEFYVFVTNSKGKMKNGSVYLSKDLNLKIVYDFGCYLEDPEEQE